MKKVEEFRRRPGWTDAQYEVMRYWASLPKTQSDKVLTMEAKARGKRRRRIERIEDSRRLGQAFKEVWE